MVALVIDDSRAMRMVLSNFLTELGFEVRQAGNGKEALDRLSENPDIELALVDWNMPEMNGLDFVKAVRGNASFDSMRLLMVTSESEMDRMVQALAAGADEYLMKPFTRDALLGKLQIVQSKVN